jgi:hypothetical protein
MKADPKVIKYDRKGTKMILTLSCHHTITETYDPFFHTRYMQLNKSHTRHCPRCQGFKKT